MSMSLTFKKVRTPKIQTVTDLREFEAYAAAASAKKYSSIRVLGNFSEISDDHPVVSAVLARWKANSKPGRRAYGDVHKIALSIEGGGMRGCVSAGATAALNILGLDDTIDVVYGSSAGAMIAAYFISRQFSGVQIYHDILPSAGKRFIDKRKLLYAAGLPRWLCFFIRKNRDTNDGVLSFIPDTELSKGLMKNNEKFLSNVINLDFLLVQVMGILQPLDWNIFTKNEASQPLKIVASSLKKFTPVIMSRQNGSYKDLMSLVECIRASMAVPGITGSMMAVSESRKSSKKELTDKFDNLCAPFNVYKRSNADHLYETTDISSETEKNSQIISRSITVQWILRSKLARIIATYIGDSIAVIIKLYLKTTGLLNSLIAREKASNSDAIGGALIDVISQMESRSDKDKIKKGRDSESSISDSMIHGLEEETATSTSSPTSSSSANNNKMNVNVKELHSRMTVEDCEPIADAFLCEPLPYRSAVDDGASHVIVLRTRPDPCHVLGKGPGVFEKFIATRLGYLHLQMYEILMIILYFVSLFFK